MVQWLIGYGVFLVWLFSVCVTTVGFKTAFWGFLLTHAGCAIATAALWWHDERHWGNLTGSDESADTTEPASVSVSATPQPVPAQPESRASADWLSLNEEDFDLLESYTENLTEQVSAVYPVVSRDHVHKIVWTVMIELFCKRAAQATQSTPASLLAARIVKAA